MLFKFPWLVVCLVLMQAPVSSQLHAANHQIIAKISDKQFHPNILYISAGDTVTWVGDGIHTVTGATNSDPLCGNTWITSSKFCVKTFTTGGTNFYRCNFHGAYGMTGSVIVSSNNFPVVNLLSPTNRFLSLPRPNIQLLVSATDVSGNIVRVDFFEGTNTNSFAFATNTVSNSIYEAIFTNTNTVGTNLRFIARATDDLGAVAGSQTNRITLYTPFTLLDYTLPGESDSSLEITNSDAGFRYALESSTNLTNWVGIETNQASTNSRSFSHPDGSIGATGRFWRVRLLPGPP